MEQNSFVVAADGNKYPILDVGGVVYILEGGWGFLDDNKGRYCVIEEYSEVDYYGEAGYLVSKYDQDLVRHDYDKDWVGVQSFGTKPMILMNIHDEHVVDPDYVVVAEGSKEEVDKALGIKRDVVNKPPHYQLTEGFEVKDLMKLVLDNIEQNMEMSHFKASCYKEMLQYLIRAPLKNGWEDIEKAQFYLNEVLKKDD